MEKKENIKLYLRIYHLIEGKVYDLLVKTNEPLPIYENNIYGIDILGVSKVEVKNIRTSLKMLK